MNEDDNNRPNDIDLFPYGEPDEGSGEFLENEDHIEFVGGLLGQVFESEEAALAALGRIVVNGKRLGNVTDIAEAVKIIRDALAKGGAEAVEVEINGVRRTIGPAGSMDDSILFDTDGIQEKDREPILSFGGGRKKKAEENTNESPEPEPAPKEPEKTNEDEADKAEKKPEREIVLEYPENDRTEDVYTFTRPDEFDLKYDTYLNSYMGSNVSGIVVLGRLSGMRLSSSGNSREDLERAADRLYVNGMPAIMFYGLGKKENMTEEDYNTLGMSIANTLRDTFMNGNKGTYVMFRGERDDKFTAFTMSSDTLINEKPKEVKPYPRLMRNLISKESREKNMAEYDNYINNLLPQYEKSMKLKEISEDALKSAAVLTPLDKIKKMSINSLQKEQGIEQRSFTPTARSVQMEKTESSLDKDPELMAPGRGSRRKKPSDSE